VPQLGSHFYLRRADAWQEELAGLRKVVHFTLDGSAMALYSTAKKDWGAESGQFDEAFSIKASDDTTGIVESAVY
jgi:hypothetical protein